MKALVVFYSLEGNTKFIAGTIARELNCDSLELRPEKEFPKSKFRKYIWGGKSVVFHEKPKLKNKISCLDNYDTVFIGTPIWASTYTPPINTFISENKISGKNIAFFACHAGGGAKKCFDKLEGELKGNTILGSIDFNDSSSDSEKREKLKEWISSIIRPKLN